MTVIKKFALTAVFLGFSVTVSLGIDGRVPIYSAIDISTPGHYYLTRDFTYTGGDAIDVLCDDVTIDLNGHTITGNGVYGGIDITGRTNITIFKGTLKNFGKGVNQNSTTRGRFSISNVTILNCADYAIYLMAVENIEITGCNIADTGGHGIWVSGNSAVFNGRVSDNNIRNTGLNGIFLEGLRSGEIMSNSIDGFGSANAGVDAGIRVLSNTDFPGLMQNISAAGNIIEGNAVYYGASGDHGIHLGSVAPMNILKKNTSMYNGGHGFYFDIGDVYSCTISENIACQNGGCGIRAINSNHLLDGNHCDENGDYGISSGGYYRNNILKSNSSGPVNGGTDAGGNIM